MLEQPRTLAADAIVARRDRAVAALCRGRTLVAGAYSDSLRTALAAAGVDRVTRAPDAPGGEAGADAACALLEATDLASCRTVVIVDVLPADDGAAAALLRIAWERVRAGGRLVVLAAHAAAGKLPGARKRRALQRLLEPFGKPKICGDQPYRWLLMYVKKPGPGAAPVPPAVAARYDVIARLCRGRVLEIGCGRGDLAAAIHQRGCDVTAMDINRAKITLARAQYPHIRFFAGDAAALHMDGEQFDTVVIAEVLEHVADDAGARILRAAHTALRPGGRLVVSVPNEKCIPHPNHVRTFTAHTLRALLRPYGAPVAVAEQPFKWLLTYVDCTA